MNISPRIINTAAALVVVGVLGYVLYAALSNVREIDVEVAPEALYPDGTSESIVEVKLTNIFGGRAWSRRTVRFVIAEGNESGEIVAATRDSARIRATYTPGMIVLMVHVQGVLLPYEVRIPVQRSYAFAGAQVYCATRTCFPAF